MNNILVNFEPWWRFALALLIGALIGLEREFVQQRGREQHFAGIRSFSLVTLFGSLAAFLSNQFGLLPFIVSLSGLVLLTLASYVAATLHAGEVEGITTEIAILLTFLLGALVIWDQAKVAIVLGVIIALILSVKGVLHRLVRRMTIRDLRMTIEFAIVAAVVLPLLPNRPIDPLGVINPFQVWLLVVFVSGIGFAGYVFMKIFGAGHGIKLTGLLGGTVSSTATTISFSTRSKETPSLSTHYAQAILLASSVMIPRVLILIMVTFAPLVRLVIIPLFTMLGITLVSVYLLQRRMKIIDQPEEGFVELSNPLKLSSAILFGLIFAFLLIFIELMQQNFGSTGVYLTSLVTGLTDVDAITLSLSRLAGDAQIGLEVAGTAVVLAAIMNSLVKAGIASTVGSPELRRSVVWAFGSVVVGGGAALAGMLLSIW